MLGIRRLNVVVKGVSSDGAAGRRSGVCGEVKDGGAGWTWRMCPFQTRSGKKDRRPSFRIHLEIQDGKEVIGASSAMKLWQGIQEVKLRAQLGYKSADGV